MAKYKVTMLFAKGEKEDSDWPRVVETPGHTLDR